MKSEGVNLLYGLVFCSDLVNNVLQAATKEDWMSHSVTKGDSHSHNNIIISSPMTFS